MRELGASEPTKQEVGPRRLSHSSSGVLLGCERRYWHKVNETSYDPDYDDDRKALRIGKGFHLVLEHCNHKRKAFNGKIFSAAMREEGIDDPQERGLIIAMCLSYFKLHERSGLKVEVCEIEVGDTHVIGYVDAVMSDPNGCWWIVDLKTAARLSQDLLSRLARDPQLNLYSYYLGDIARELGLDHKLAALCGNI